MIEINIIATGPKGALEYHRRSRGHVNFDAASSTLTIREPFDRLVYRGVKLLEVTDQGITLEGTEPAPSGSGMLGPLRLIHITW